MKLTPRSTSTRLALAVMASLLLAFVLLGAGVYYAVSTLLLQDARELVRTDSAGLVDLYRENGRGELVEELRRRVDAPEDPDAVYMLAKPDGAVIVGTYPELPSHRPGARWIEFTEDARAGPRRNGDDPRVVAHLQPLPDGSTLLTGLRLRSQERFHVFVGAAAQHRGP